MIYTLSNIRVPKIFVKGHF